MHTQCYIARKKSRRDAGATNTTTAFVFGSRHLLKIMPISHAEGYGGLSTDSRYSRPIARIIFHFQV